MGAGVLKNYKSRGKKMRNYFKIFTGVFSQKKACDNKEINLLGILRNPHMEFQKSEVSKKRFTQKRNPRQIGS
jgi:hypothetical protein